MAKAPATVPAQAGKPATPGTASGQTGQSSQDKPADAKAKKSSGGISVIAFIVLTVVAAVAGGGFGAQISALLVENIAVKEASKTEEQKTAKLNMSALPLPPITTNLSGTSRIWVRMECSLVTPVEMADQAVTLTGEVGEDIIAYLRTVSMEQLDGPGGFQHLREDLNDRVRIRTGGKAIGLVIQALIIE